MLLPGYVPICSARCAALNNVNPQATGNEPIIVAAKCNGATYPQVDIAVETRNRTIALLPFVASRREVAEFLPALAKAQKEKRLPTIF